MANPKLKVDLIVDDKGSLVVQRFGDNTNNVMWSSQAAAKGLSSELKVVGGAVTTLLASGALLGRGVVNISDEYTLLESRLSLVTDSAVELAEVEEKLYQAALETHTAYSSTSILFTGLSRATKELGLSKSELVDITDKLNKSAVISGATQDESSRSMRQLNQAMQGGIVRSEEYNSILENTPRVLEAVAEGLGVNLGQLRQMMLESKLTSELFLQGLQNGAAGIDIEFANMATTARQSLGDLKTVFNAIIFDSSKSASVTSMLSGEIQNLVHYLDDNRESVVEYFGKGLEGVVAFGQGIKNLGNDAKPYLEGTASAVQAIYTATQKLETIGGPDSFEWGIIGYALLRGGPQAAALTGSLVTVNRQLDELNLGLSSLTSFSIDNEVNNMLDVLSGKRDWNTGEFIDTSTGDIKSAVDTIESEISRLESIADGVGDPFTDFFRKAFTGEERSQEHLDYIDNIKQRIESLKRELSSIGNKDFDEGLGSWTSDFDGHAQTLQETEEAATKTTKEIKALEKATTSLHDIKISLLPDGLEKDLALIEVAKEKLKKRVEQLGTAADYSAPQVAALNSEIDKIFNRKINDATAKALLDTGESYNVMISDMMAGKDKLLPHIIDQSDLLSPTAVPGVEQDLDRLFDDHNELWEGAAKETADIQGLLVNNLGNIMDGYIYDVLDRQIDDIGDLFAGLFDSIADMFLKMVSQMAANSLVESILGTGASGGMTLGSLFSGGAGSSAISLGGIASKISGWLGGPTIGGAAAAGASALGLGATTAVEYGVSGGQVLGALPAMESAVAGGVAEGMATAEAAGAATTGGGLASTLATTGAVGLLAFNAFMFGKAMFGPDPIHSTEDITATVGDKKYSDLTDGEFAVRSETWANEMRDTLNDLQGGMGDSFNLMRAQLLPTTGSVEGFVESLTGLDISFEESILLLEEGLDGNAKSISNFLESIGASSTAANAAAVGLVASLDQATESERAMATIANQTGAELKQAGDVYTMVFGKAEELKEGGLSVREAMDDMSSAITVFSDKAGYAAKKISGTDFNLRGNDDPNSIKGYADGGILQGGSGLRDDLYMGKVGGSHILAKGGEYFMPPEQTAMYYNDLEAMRAKRYAGGGIVSSSTPAPPLDYKAGPQTDTTGWDPTDISMLIRYMDIFNDVISESTLSDYAKDVHDLSSQYYEMINAMKAAGAAEQDLAKARAAHQIELATLNEKHVHDIESFMSGYEDILATSGMSNYEKQIYSLNERYDDAVDRAMELGVSQQDLNKIESARIIELQGLETAAEGSFTNLADVLQEIEQYGIQGAVTGDTYGSEAIGDTGSKGGYDDQVDPAPDTPPAPAIVPHIQGPGGGNIVSNIQGPGLIEPAYLGVPPSFQQNQFSNFEAKIDELIKALGANGQASINLKIDGTGAARQFSKYIQVTAENVVVDRERTGATGRTHYSRVF